MSDRCGLWFGVHSPGSSHFEWMRTPKAGATMSPKSWQVDGTFVNGGGFVRHAWGNHREYVFEWPDSSSRETAAKMQAYRNGTYGRGLIYFIDPLIYDQNILPARWADPSMAIGDEGASLVKGVYPEGVVTQGAKKNGLPIRSAYYNLDNVPAFDRGDDEKLFVPIPEGYTLYLGAFYQDTGSAFLFATPVDEAGNNGPVQYVLPTFNNSDTWYGGKSFTGGSGVKLWIGKAEPTKASITLTAIIARLYKTGEQPPAEFFEGPWTPGLGHSGCRFVGNPTYVANTGVNGGQIGFAATFKEVGDWT